MANHAAVRNGVRWKPTVRSPAPPRPVYEEYAVLMHPSTESINMEISNLEARRVAEREEFLRRWDSTARAKEEKARAAEALAALEARTRSEAFTKIASNAFAGDQMPRARQACRLQACRKAGLKIPAPRNGAFAPMPAGLVEVAAQLGITQRALVRDLERALLREEAARRNGARRELPRGTPEPASLEGWSRHRTSAYA